MYRCEFCRSVSKPGEPRRVHVVSRRVPERVCEIFDRRGNVVGIQRTPARMQIEREIPVCSICEAFLKAGGSIPHLRIDAARRTAAESGTIAPAPASKIKPAPLVAGGKSVTKRPTVSPSPLSGKKGTTPPTPVSSPSVSSVPAVMERTSEAPSPSKGPRKATRRANQSRKAD